MTLANKILYDILMFYQGMPGVIVNQICCLLLADHCFCTAKRGLAPPMLSEQFHQSDLSMQSVLAKNPMVKGHALFYGVKSHFQSPLALLIEK